MYAEERQREILLLARAEGRVDVVAVAAHYGVTTETVRRDLTVLERAGHVRRVHGGAIPVERLGFEPTLSDRDTVMTAEKERIAKAALAELPEDGAILLDAGIDHPPVRGGDPRRPGADRGGQLAAPRGAVGGPTGTDRDHDRRSGPGPDDGRRRRRRAAAAGPPARGRRVHGDERASTERGLTTPDPAEAASRER